MWNHKYFLLFTIVVPYNRDHRYPVMVAYQPDQRRRKVKIGNEFIYTK